MGFLKDSDPLAEARSKHPGQLKLVDRYVCSPFSSRIADEEPDSLHSTIVGDAMAGRRGNSRSSLLVYERSE